jgi:hypothetical protein
MASSFVLPDPKLRLILVRAPDDPPLFSEQYQSELADFARSLGALGIEFSCLRRMLAAAGASGGLTGEFIFVVSALGPVAIVQLRKLLEAFLVHGRKMKLTSGGVKIEGSARDIQKLLTPEQIEKLLKPNPRKKLPHG